ncbi:MAG TPA: hypothetical protein VEC94_16575 [Pseudolabrys sp.]|jgi:hypothetical protein|nr:hypothetical protein [Pseudolabrys sp.]
MKSILAVAIFLTLTVAATAKFAPVDDLDRSADQAAALASNDADIEISASVARERDFFQAPRPQFNTGNVSCRLQLSVFDKTRLAQSCN